jgi:hypothetical protein
MTKIQEIWKDIEGHPGYQVSNLGAVRNLGGQLIRLKSGFRVCKPKTLKPWASHGYLIVTMPGQKKTSVHRLVAKAFCDGYFDGAQVNHKNGVRSDPRAENLEWVNQSQNIRHSFDELKRLPSWNCFLTGSKSNVAKPIIAINPSGQEFQYACAVDAAREHGFTRPGISAVLAGTQKTHRGWSFRFQEIDT